MAKLNFGQAFRNVAPLLFRLAEENIEQGGATERTNLRIAGRKALTDEQNKFNRSRIRQQDFQAFERGQILNDLSLQQGEINEFTLANLRNPKSETVSARDRSVIDLNAAKTQDILSGLSAGQGDDNAFAGLSSAERAGALKIILTNVFKSRQEPVLDVQGDPTGQFTQPQITPAFSDTLNSIFRTGTVPQDTALQNTGQQQGGSLPSGGFGGSLQQLGQDLEIANILKGKDINQLTEEDLRGLTEREQLVLLNFLQGQ